MPNLVLAAAGLPEVLIALIAGLPGIIGALAALKANARAKDVQKSIETPSGTTIGRQVENTQHVSLANHYRIRSMTNGLDIPDSQHAQSEARKADNIVHDDEGQTHIRMPGDKPKGDMGHDE